MPPAAEIELAEVKLPSAAGCTSKVRASPWMQSGRSVKPKRYCASISISSFFFGVASCDFLSAAALTRASALMA